MVYDKRSATFHRNYVFLLTVDGRTEYEFFLPADSPTPFERYVLSNEYEFRASTLQYDRATDEFYFHITTRKYDSDSDHDADDSTDTENQTVLGVNSPSSEQTGGRNNNVATHNRMLRKRNHLDEAESDD